MSELWIITSIRDGYGNHVLAVAETEKIDEVFPLNGGSEQRNTK
jgi:hypothetical protein